MRNKRLDVLRCIAVLLVLILHGNISSFFGRVGWTGVDLFFVLSGFLISGLLFSEYQKYKSISFKRFFIRRGLKIYPSFYLFLLLTAIISALALHRTPARPEILHNVFFLMNYLGGSWDHLWSLAVEEHFYLLLPIFLLTLVRFASDREDPFRPLPWIFAAIALACLAARAISVFTGTPNFQSAYVASHNRVDSLFFGVLLGYGHHFHSFRLAKVMQSRVSCLAIACFCTAALSMAYFLPRERRIFAVLGYSTLYLGFGGSLLLSLYVHGIVPIGTAKATAKIGTLFAYIGRYSYSIYLWHGPAASWLPGLVRRTLHFPTGPIGRFTVYFAGALVLGVAMSMLVEYPVLRLRDRLFPQGQITAV